MSVISTANAEHYTWPSAPSPASTGDQICDGWHLHRSAELSVIEERMPPATAERRHLHQRATQFFYVLAGELTIELAAPENGNIAHRLPPGTGLTIPAAAPHQVFNRGPAEARFLVVSQPPSHGDRIAAEAK